MFWYLSVSLTSCSITFLLISLQLFWFPCYLSMLQVCSHLKAFTFALILAWNTYPLIVNIHTLLTFRFCSNITLVKPSQAILCNIATISLPPLLPSISYFIVLLCFPRSYHKITYYIVYFFVCALPISVHLKVNSTGAETFLSLQLIS